ncbi:hypothetical protein Skr01_29770 [Sphaerisporangium krabiense]|uniref:DUF1707 domain-containing protein n=1 Tax=Sphaerisporangium krabiense TaxID=763782 RepID=A0A7W8Z1R9_9ACTN|nr:DUF1707 domain-containing protein [Sphaerisporangium krabiense]MBB5625772.1 hypothetical protein [Sphaerisporangium krabiense]GII62892.1 hypothetical protein Skr01_29770 [Sphaerisporangium krabiense]
MVHGNPNLRADDADRDQVTALLSEAYGTGRLTRAELDDRLERTQTARYRGDLQDLVRDLQATPYPPSHPQTQHTPWQQTPQMPDLHSQGSYSPGPYPPGSYSPGPHAQGPYSSGAYAQTPYAQGPYGQSATPQGLYSQGPYSQGPLSPQGSHLPPGSGPGHQGDPGYQGESLPPHQLQQILDQQITHRLAMGWRLESRHGWQAVLTYGEPLNPGVHIAHAAITLLTCLVWAIVWAIHASRSGIQRRELISIDAHGNIHVQPLPK